MSAFLLSQLAGTDRKENKYLCVCVFGTPGVINTGFYTREKLQQHGQILIIISQFKGPKAGDT